MVETVKKHQRAFLVGLIAICTGIMVVGAVLYLGKIRDKLKANAIQSVMDVTMQQRQAFENFISGDRERLHIYAEYFAGSEGITEETVNERLNMFRDVDSVYTVACLDDGWYCSNVYEEIRQLNEEQLEFFRSLSGSGIWDNHIGIFSGVPMFGCYETFTLQNGHRALVQKAYERSAVLETFTLSIYDGQGYGYILNRDGDILLRSVSMSGSKVYDNVFNALSDTHNAQTDIDAFRASLEAQETGSIVFSGDNGSYIYTFTPIESADGWHMLSIVPVDAIQNEASGILRDSQMTVGFFALMLAFISMFALLVWRIQKENRERERKARNDLAEALRMAQAANEAKSAFLSSVSHDIRTPMNAIIGFLALMRDEVDNPEAVMEYNKRIDAASQHLLGLINDVLDMNKIESGSTTLSISEMDMADIINEINTIIRPQSNAKNQTFDIFASHLNHEHLMGDKMRINQILINLLSNAVKYTPEKGAVRLNVEELPQVVSNYSRVRFTVSDNGLGMSEEYLKVIFDPFTREETKTTSKIQGTGLGMAITKSLVDLMGGTIKVESKQGEGSTFIVELELRIQEREDDPKFWTNHKIARMIVADDDEEVCRTIVKIMGKAGVETDYTTDGKTAVRRMRENREAGRPYDLILLDWKMPGLSGLETACLIRKDYPDKIPILLLTAYDWSEIEQEAAEIGIEHFMAKPFFMSTFKEAVKRITGRQEKPTSGQSDVVRDKHVLVVDDIEVNRMILLKILGSLGAVCDSAADGQEAVDKFESSQPGDYDLILMDVQMPVMDGYTATRTIRSSGHPSAKSVAIIAMTANAFVDDVREAIESGMDAHIAKPVQIDNLKATIQQVLDSRVEQVDG